eukprot:9081692-Pyramimonas_sp.AAC.1
MPLVRSMMLRSRYEYSHNIVMLPVVQKFRWQRHAVRLYDDINSSHTGHELLFSNRNFVTLARLRCTDDKYSTA